MHFSAHDRNEAAGGDLAADRRAHAHNELGREDSEAAAAAQDNGDREPDQEPQEAPVSTTEYVGGRGGGESWGVGGCWGEGGELGGVGID